MSDLQAALAMVRGDAASKALRRNGGPTRAAADDMQFGKYFADEGRKSLLIDLANGRGGEFIDAVNDQYIPMQEQRSGIEQREAYAADRGIAPQNAVEHLSGQRQMQGVAQVQHLAPWVSDEVYGTNVPEFNEPAPWDPIDDALKPYGENSDMALNQFAQGNTNPHFAEPNHDVRHSAYNSLVNMGIPERSANSITGASGKFGLADLTGVASIMDGVSGYRNEDSGAMAMAGADLGLSALGLKGAAGAARRVMAKGPWK